MIKLTFCLTRRPGFTRETFQDQWFNTHAPLCWGQEREIIGLN